MKEMGEMKDYSELKEWVIYGIVFAVSVTLFLTVII